MSRYDIDSNLNCNEVSIPVDSAGPWIAADLDLDGNIELVTQFSDDLSIYSAPDWVLRHRFVFPGMNVVMNATAFNLDDDPFLEIYATPNSFVSSRVILVKYNPATDDFDLIADVPVPIAAIGRPAIGDFDEDGRMEFISGNNFNGYELFEWQDPVLVHIGLVGDTTLGNNFCAVACRPKPGDTLYALLGHSSGSSGLGFYYRLLKPAGDNTFEVVRVFQEFTGWQGAHPCHAVDTDCDGLDELAMCFYPDFKVWEWNTSQEDFTEGCIWNRDTYGTLVSWYRVDLDQNGVNEWGTVNHDEIFRSFPDPECVYCDTNGTCGFSLDCYCVCDADPQCDSVLNVLDVATAVNVAFRSAEPVPDPFPQCPVERTDVDCSGFTNVLDVVHLVNVAFRGGGSATEFCNPCGP